MNAAGIVLCGGGSRRMGKPKHELPFGDESLIKRVLSRLRRAELRPLLVVASPDQPPPDLPADVELVRDATEGRGPMEGLYAGLSALERRAEAAFVVGCDAPWIEPRFVRRIVDLLGRRQIAVPADAARRYPLAAAYRSSVLPILERLRAADRTSLLDLLDEANTRLVPVETLREVDPRLRSLVNLNRPEQYVAALAEAGFPPLEAESPDTAGRHGG